MKVDKATDSARGRGERPGDEKGTEHSAEMRLRDNGTVLQLPRHEDVDSGEEYIFMCVDVTSKAYRSKCWTDHE